MSGKSVARVLCKPLPFFLGGGSFWRKSSKYSGKVLDRLFWFYFVLLLFACFCCCCFCFCYCFALFCFVLFVCLLVCFLFLFCFVLFCFVWFDFAPFCFVLFVCVSNSSQWLIESFLSKRKTKQNTKFCLRHWIKTHTKNKIKQIKTNKQTNYIKIKNKNH